jgi:hypothetical protein
MDMHASVTDGTELGRNRLTELYLNELFSWSGQVSTGLTRLAKVSYWYPLDWDQMLCLSVSL